MADLFFDGWRPLLRTVLIGLGAYVSLVHRGEFLHATMRSCRVTEEEVLAALRAAGVADRRTVHAVVLETDASFSVIEGPDADGAASSLAGVRRDEETPSRQRRDDSSSSGAPDSP